MKLLRIAAATLAAFVLAIASSAAQAQQNQFTILSGGLPTGKCVYTFDKAKDGYKIASRFQSRIAPRAVQGPAAEGEEGAMKMIVEVQQIHNFKIDGNFQYLGSSVQDSVTQMTNGFSFNKQRTLLTISHVQAGAAESMPQMPIQHDPILLPEFDASPYQALLLMATNHPPADGLYFLIVPSNIPHHGPLNGQARWTRAADTSGTLDGKPVVVHHFSLPFGEKNDYEIYADPDNTLLQVDVKDLKSSYVRNGFVLDKQDKK